MIKYSIYFVMLVLFFSFMLQDVRAEGGTAEAALNINTPSARNLGTGAQLAELARIDVTAVNSPLYLQGIQLGTDVSGGLSNFIEIIVYNQTNNAVIGSYHSSDGQDTFQFSTIVISNPPTKTFVIRGTPSSSASGIVRVGFKNLIFGETTTQINVPIYGNAVTLPGIMPTPTPSTSSGPTPSASATPTPLVTPKPLAEADTPASLGFTTLASLNLYEGDTISAAGSADPDIYIVNDWGYKRLFLNPVIFGFYGHLGFSSVKNTISTTRDMLVTSGLFRNCEANDEKVYGLETTGENTGVLHWVNTSGAQAVQDDPDFFNKVFCINSNEFNWYTNNGTTFGSDYTSVSQVPPYSR